MPTAAFWQLIDQAAAATPADPDAKAQHLIGALAARPLEDIIGFELTLRRFIIEADDYGIMAAQKIIDGYVSDDPYLYFRCWLIGQGQAVFTAALQHPDSLAAVAPGPYECDFESLLLVATKAYEQQTGREEDETFPRAVARGQGLDYDFLAPPTTGADWEEEDLPKMLPKLWKKFR
ncbi:DUF4240 domain-containing protein [Hymenobacter sp. 15J16-1T3B]|uniref:DUF4240 domain-containing protein n=1 Tax=Hymenobacter sp. 15J16-1T3B TaxID=2886941 RepID=UPI001D1103B6|nr:DUF4240 domain-containing protein [Hymenobacter sp. 15J16-1T3B]MCC3157449.1 DUF4240 domain-containing protein [Hymenobacter sp. 15J16-1T3B]